MSFFTQEAASAHVLWVQDYEAACLAACVDVALMSTGPARYGDTYLPPASGGQGASGGLWG